VTVKRYRTGDDGYLRLPEPREVEFVLATDHEAAIGECRAEVARYQEFAAAAVTALRGHRWCGDQYPENGWEDVNKALALYSAALRGKEGGT
jgi:hypothetical protein